MNMLGFECRGKALYHNPTVAKEQNGWAYGVPVPITINSYPTGRYELVRQHSYDGLNYFELFSDGDEINPATLGRFTGVWDKKDKPVYEGDIVKLDDSVKMFFNLTDVGVVEYDHGAFFVSKYRTKVNNLFALTDGLYILRGEVIGNIYDNPKLLEDLEEGSEK